jgi:hypothetical protein
MGGALSKSGCVLRLIYWRVAKAVVWEVREGYGMLDTDRSQDQVSRERDRTYQINIKKVKIINHSDISERQDVAGYRVTLLSLYWCW